MSPSETPEFFKDPRRYGDPRRYEEDRKSDSWEDLGALDDFIFEDWANVMKDCFGIQLDKHSKLLEVGTGKGEFFKRLREQGYDIIGVDARPRHEGALPIAAARIERLPFPDESFDLVIAASIFDYEAYVQDRSKMLNEIVRVLKPSGIFLFAFSNGYSQAGVGGHKRLNQLNLGEVYKGHQGVYQKIK